MRTLLYLLLSGLFVTACSPKAQLVTLRGTNLRTVPNQGLVMDTDTVTLRYSFCTNAGR